jgi:tRNA(Ile)-lysidine synthase
MKQKSLSVKNKINKLTFSYLKDKRISQIYKKFESILDINNKFAVALSGGPDSLALVFLTRCFALKYNLNVKYFIVDHKLRRESSSEAKIVVKNLKNFGINCKILSWIGKKPSSNIQSIARENRYRLLIRECKKNNIKNILFGHHLDDLFENFFIRFLRGSGLKGLISLSKNTQYKESNINILRPLLDFEKKDLIYLSKKVFNFYIEDSSNKNENFKRIRVRMLLKKLQKEGLDKNKFLLTLNNLKDSDQSIKFYVDKNIRKNSKFLKIKNTFILNSIFFDQSHEIIFRSLSKIIKIIGKKYYAARGKSVNEVILKIKSNSLRKVTLGGCFIEKINKTVLIYKEH